MSAPSDPPTGQAPKASQPGRATFDRWLKQHPFAGAAVVVGVIFTPTWLTIAARHGLPLSKDQQMVASWAVWGGWMYCAYGSRLALDQEGTLQRYQNLAGLLRLNLQAEHPPWWRERLTMGRLGPVPVWPTFAAWLVFTGYALRSGRLEPQPNTALWVWFTLYGAAATHLREARHLRRQQFKQQVDEALGSAAKNDLDLHAQKKQLENEIAVHQDELRMVNQLLSGEGEAVANALRRNQAGVEARMDSLGSALRDLTGLRTATITFVLGIIGGIIANELGHWMGLP